MKGIAKRIAARGAGVVLAAALAACAPSPADGLLVCNPTGKACPDGYSCANDGTCWRTGHAPDLSSNGDMPAPDLANDLGARDLGANDSDLMSLPDDLLQSVDVGAAGDLTPVLRSVTITIQGPGSGAVSGGGLDCNNLGGTCTISVPDGTVIDLAATPADADNAFTGWLDDCTGAVSPCQLTVTGGNKMVTAKFAPVFDLSVSFQRSTDCGTSNQADVGITTSLPGLTLMNCYSCRSAAFICHAKFVAGSSFTITATPGFAGTPCTDEGGTATLANPAMTGGCTANTSGGGFSTSPASCILTMDSNKSITVFTCQQSG